MKKISIALLLTLALIVPALAAPKAKSCCASKAKVTQVAKSCCADKAEADMCAKCKKKAAKSCCKKAQAKKKDCCNKAQAKKKRCCEKMAQDKGCGSAACGWFSASKRADCKSCDKTAQL